MGPPAYFVVLLVSKPFFVSLSIAGVAEDCSTLGVEPLVNSLRVFVVVRQCPKITDEA